MRLYHGGWIKTVFYFTIFLPPLTQNAVNLSLFGCCVAGGEIDVVNVKRRLDVNWETWRDSSFFEIHEVCNIGISVKLLM